MVLCPGMSSGVTMKPFLAAALAVAVLLAPGAASARPFTAKDLAMLDRLADPQVSPDGRLVAYNVRSTDWDANRAVHALWVLERNADKPQPRPLVERQAAPTTPRWSADGRWLYYLSAASGSLQVWKAPAAGGAPVQVTDLPLDVDAYRLADGDKTLVAALDTYPDCPDLACSRARRDQEARGKASGLFYDGAAPRFFDTYEDQRFVGLFVVSLAAAPATTARALAPGLKADMLDRPPGGDADFALTADSVIFSARPVGSDYGDTKPASLYVAPLDGSAPPRRLEPASTTSDAKPTLSPDGRLLAYLAEDGAFATAAPILLKLRDLGSGSVRVLSDGQALTFGQLAWGEDGKTLYAVAEVRGQSKLYAIDPAGGAARALTGDGSVSAFDPYRGGVVYGRDALDSPVELYDLADGKPRRLTSTRALDETPMSPAEQFSFAGWNGETVFGYVLKPHGWKPGQKYPVAFLIHGGPHGSFPNSWSYRWNPQVWTGQGYGVVMIDFHGSSGYGAAFAQSIRGHWGDRPLEDLQKGWAHALAAYPWLDGERACALGGSYGGYMINWIAGVWSEPWKCLVNHAGLFDLRTFAYSTDITRWTEDEFGGQPWKDPTAIERFNPADKVAAWNTPMLVTHGARDYRVPLDQGTSAYGALRRRGTPSQFLVFPDENHWVLKPQNLVQWFEVKEAWLNRWIGDKAQ